MKPPSHLDSAQVLYWAWSGDKPFGTMQDENTGAAIEIYGFAICLLSGQLYRFSCDRKWEVQNDSEFPSLQEAIDALDYQGQILNWKKFDDTDIDKLMSENQSVKFFREVGGRRIIQNIISHLNEHDCNGMNVQSVAKDTWVLSILKKDVQIASEIAKQNVD